MELRERAEPLARLAAAGEAAGRGEGRVVLVRGPTGIGKTTLVRAFLDAEDGPAALLGRCDNASVPLVLGPFRDIVDAAGHDLRGMDAASLREAVLEELPGAACVVIEDLHWADEASTDLLAHIAKRIEPRPLLLILTMRRTDDPQLARLLSQIPQAALVDIELQPLSPAAVLEMATAVDRDGATLYELTDGIPFLVAEALAAPPGGVTTRLTNASVARLGALSPRAAEMAGLLAVFPAGAEWPLLESLRPGSTDVIEELERSGLIEESAGRVMLRHELIRRAIEDWLPVGRRRQLNHQVLDAIDTGSVDPGRVAHHAYHAGDLARFVDSTIVAARDYARAGAHRDALRHLERIAPHEDLLGAEERARFTEAFANELTINNRWAEAHRLMREAMQRWTDLGNARAAARALQAASGATWRLGKPEQSLAETEQALTLLEGTGDREAIARTRILVAQTIGLLSRWPETLARLDAVAADLGDAGPAVAAMALGVRATARRILGDGRGGRADEARSLELAQSSGDDAVTMTGYSNRVATSLGTLELEAIDEEIETATRHAVAIESESGRSVLMIHAARLQLLRGEWDESLETLRQVHAEDEQTVFHTTALLVEGLIRIRRGDASGPELLERARQRAAAAADIQRLGPIGVALAELTWLGGYDDPAPIIAIARLAERSGHRRFTAELAVWSARLGLNAIEAPPSGPAPLLADVAGDWEGAAARWHRLGCPYHRLLSLGFATDPEPIRRAIDEAKRLGASATADRLRARLRSLGYRVSRGPSRTTLANPGGLTTRQVDVIRLLANGLSNREIADRLFISAKTVDHHVSAILTRLDLPDRHAAGAWARGQSLAD